MTLDLGDTRPGRHSQVVRFLRALLRAGANSGPVAVKWDRSSRHYTIASRRSQGGGTPVRIYDAEFQSAVRAAVRAGWLVAATEPPIGTYFLTPKARQLLEDLG